MDGHDHLVIPYTLDANDFKFLLVNGFVTAREFAEYLVDTLDQLRREGGRMMSVGLHCRIVGRPGRAPALRRFLEHVATCDDVWLASAPTSRAIGTQLILDGLTPSADRRGDDMPTDDEVQAALDDFDADTGIYRERGFQRRVGFGHRPALVHIDLGNAWTSRARVLLRWDGHHHPCRAGPERGRAGQGIPIVYTTTAYEDVEGQNSDMGLWVHKIPVELLQLGTNAVEIDERIAPQPGELLIVKRASGFHGISRAI